MRSVLTALLGASPEVALGLAGSLGPLLAGTYRCLLWVCRPVAELRGPPLKCQRYHEPGPWCIIQVCFLGTVSEVRSLLLWSFLELTAPLGKQSRHPRLERTEKPVANAFWMGPGMWRSLPWNLLCHRNGKLISWA